MFTELDIKTHSNWYSHIVQGHRQVCKSGGGGWDAYMQIFGYSPLKAQCTVNRMNLPSLLSTPL